MTPTEIIEHALYTNPAVDAGEVELRLAGWQHASIASLGPHASKAEVHAIQRQADLARGRYAAIIKRLERSAKHAEERQAANEQRAAARAALRDPASTPSDVLISVAKNGKPSDVVSACQALLNRSGGGASMFGSTALFVRPVPDPTATLDFEQALELAATAPPAGEAVDPRAIALERLNAIIASADATDLDNVRAAKALLAQPVAAATGSSNRRDVWIVRGRERDPNFGGVDVRFRPQARAQTP